MTSSSLAVGQWLVRAGVQLVASLPDQWLAPLLQHLDSWPDLIHVPVAREDDGVAVCAGAAYGGMRSALLVQNAGLLLAGNALASAVYLYRAPFLILASHRGAGGRDEFFHVPKAPVVRRFLSALEVPTRVLSRPGQLQTIPAAMDEAIRRQAPAALLLHRELLQPDPEGRWPSGQNGGAAGCGPAHSAR